MYKSLATAGDARRRARRATVWAFINLAICIVALIATIAAQKHAEQEAVRTGFANYSTWWGAVAGGGFFFLLNSYRSINFRRLAARHKARAALQVRQAPSPPTYRWAPSQRFSSSTPVAPVGGPDLARGQSAPLMRTCSSCGVKFPSSNRFCGDCGAERQVA